MAKTNKDNNKKLQAGIADALNKYHIANTSKTSENIIFSILKGVDNE